MSKDTYNEMRKAITAARELGYPKEVIYALRCARDVIEMSRILTTARHICK